MKKGSKVFTKTDILIEKSFFNKHPQYIDLDNRDQANWLRRRAISRWCCDKETHINKLIKNNKIFYRVTLNTENVSV
jgi:hypothetical protein